MASIAFGGLLHRHARQILDPLSFIALFLAAWWVFVEVTGIHPAALPGPDRVFLALRSRPDILVSNMIDTIEIVVVGFVIGGAIGVLFGIVLVYSAKVRRALLPLLVVFFVAPKAVFVPLFLLWFGVNDFYKVLVTVLLVFFPVTENMMAGLRGVELEMLELNRSLRGSDWLAFRKIRLPFSLPFMLAGLKIGLTEAFIGVILAELLAPTSGIGSLIMDASRQQSTSIILAGIIVIGLFGIVSYYLFEALERRLTFWQY